MNVLVTVKALAPTFSAEKWENLQQLFMCNFDYQLPAPAILSTGHTLTLSDSLNLLLVLPATVLVLYNLVVSERERWQKYALVSLSHILGSS